MKRVVTAFLQMTDRYRGPSLLLAATNHAGLLDDALWRRFDEVLTFRKPTVHELRRLLRLRTKCFAHEPLPIEKYAGALKGLPHAAVDKLIADARRAAVLRHADSVTVADVEQALSSVIKRPW
jgi:AAA+ superfamily predicted ATPase